MIPDSVTLLSPCLPHGSRLPNGSSELKPCMFHLEPFDLPRLFLELRSGLAPSATTLVTYCHIVEKLIENLYPCLEIVAPKSILMITMAMGLNALHLRRQRKQQQDPTWPKTKRSSIQTLPVVTFFHRYNYLLRLVFTFALAQDRVNLDEFMKNPRFPRFHNRSQAHIETS